MNHNKSADSHCKTSLQIYSILTKKDEYNCIYKYPNTWKTSQISDNKKLILFDNYTYILA